MIGPTDLLHSSPAPHFKIFRVFLICCSERPSFSTIQSYWWYWTKTKTKQNKKPQRNLWLTRLYNILSRYLINGATLKKKLWKITRFDFSLQVLSAIFLTVGRIQHDNIINVYRSSCKVPLFVSDFNQTSNFLYRFSKHIQIPNFMKIHPEFHENPFRISRKSVQNFTKIRPEFHENPSRISRKSVQWEPSFSLRTDRHNEADSPFL
jgi:hypothetical protein